MTEEEVSPSFKVKPNKITFSSEEKSAWSIAGGDGGSNEEEEEDPELDGFDAIRMMREPFEKASRPSKAEVNSAYGKQQYTGSFTIDPEVEISPDFFSLYPEHLNVRCSTEQVETDGGPDFGVEKIECPHCGDEFTEYDDEWIEGEGEKYCSTVCLNEDINT